MFSCRTTPAGRMAELRGGKNPCAHLLWYSEYASKVLGFMYYTYTFYFKKNYAILPANGLTPHPD